MARITSPTLASLALLALLLLGCGRYDVRSPCTLGSGHLINESRDVAQFDAVRFSGRGNLHLIQDGSSGVRISAEDNIIPHLLTSVENGTLVIGSNRTCMQPRKPIDVYVSTAALKAVTANGFADIDGTPITSDILAIEMNGAGKVNLTVHAQNLTTRISGSADADYAGDARDSAIIISGAGNVRALGLVTDSTRVEISGTGRSDVHATSSLDVRISGSGDITYTGTPQVSQEISGRGTIRQADSAR